MTSDTWDHCPTCNALLFNLDSCVYCDKSPTIILDDKLWNKIDKALHELSSEANTGSRS